MVRSAQGLLQTLLEQPNLRPDVVKKAQGISRAVQKKLTANDYTSSWSETGFLNVQVRAVAGAHALAQ